MSDQNNASILWFEDVRSEDVGLVGGKTSALGELIAELQSAGVRVPGGFAVTAHAYREFLDHNDLVPLIADKLEGIDTSNIALLEERARLIRERVAKGAFPPAMEDAIREAYAELSRRAGVPAVSTAVRSSATAEDLPTASFAGQQDTYLHIAGADEVVEATRRCFASLFTARAIDYRASHGYGNLDVALSVAIQRMVRSDLSASGVMFTIDPDSGHSGFVYVTSAWGLGETVVQGRVVPDAFHVHKHTVERGFSPIVRRQLGTKRVEMVLSSDKKTVERDVEPARQALWSLTDPEVLQLARWGVIIEKHFTDKVGHAMPMDIEWAKDGVTGELFIVQARPETVHAQSKGAVLRRWEIKPDSAPLLQGLAIGGDVAYGPVRVVRDPSRMNEVCQGDVLVAESTDPDWEPVMKRCSAIITERGGRTSHAAIVAREHGLAAIVGAEGAIDALRSAGEVTVSCAEGSTGRVYAGHVPATLTEIPIVRQASLRTKVMVLAGDPDTAFDLAQLPIDGVGLALIRLRMAFPEESTNVLADLFAAWAALGGPMDWVRKKLTSDARVSVAAALALGDTRDAAHLDVLAEFAQREPHSDRQRTGYVAIALLRCDDGLAFLLRVVRTAPWREAITALEALEMYTHHDDMWAQVTAAASQHDDERVAQRAARLTPRTKERQP